MVVSGNLKTLDLCSVSDERVVYRRKKKDNLQLRNSQKKAQWHKAGEKGRKRIFQERKSVARHQEKHDDCDR